VSTSPGGATPIPSTLDVKQVAARLSCSWRHVFRMADRGEIPWGFKLGALRRWDATELEEWIANSCKSSRRRGGRGQ
jgi:excisionase family DNA binding protein